MIQHTTMKTRTFAYYLSALLLTACITDFPDSTVDPLPLPPEVETNKDTSVKPGDSFFDYCNGSWLKATPYPATGAVGGVYKAHVAMDQRMEELKRNDPDISRFFALMDDLHQQPEESQAYIDAQKACYPKPTTREEAYAIIGRLVMDGAAPGVTFSISWAEGKWAGQLYPPLRLPSVSTDSTPEEMVPLILTKADDSAPVQIIRGMGLDPSRFVTSESMDKYWAEFEALPLEGLWLLIAGAWDKYEEYVSEEQMEKARKTEEDLRAEARLSLNYTLSYHFAQKYLSAAFKDKFLGITREFQSSLRNRIQHVAWMSETTRKNAIEKLDNCMLSVIYPDQWHSDCVSQLATCQTLVEAVHRNRCGFARLLAELIGTSDRFTRQLTMNELDSNGNYQPTDLTFVNAMYDPYENNVYIYPGLLLPPCLPENVSQAYDYAFFSIIGHELTHGFDSMGSQFDKDGRLRNWWTVADKMAFEERQENLVQCYDHMEMDPDRYSGVYGDGRRTLFENIADLGGFLTALDAYKAHLKADGYFGKVYDDQLRKFYESFANVWCIQYSSEKFWILEESDVHSHARLRVNGVVMNTDLWYELYDVDRNNYLYLPKDRRTYIW